MGKAKPVRYFELKNTLAKTQRPPRKPGNEFLVFLSVLGVFARFSVCLYQRGLCPPYTLNDALTLCLRGAGSNPLRGERGSSIAPSGLIVRVVSLSLRERAGVRGERSNNHCTVMSCK